MNILNLQLQVCHIAKKITTAIKRENQVQLIKKDKDKAEKLVKLIKELL